MKTPFGFNTLKKKWSTRCIGCQFKNTSMFQKAFGRYSQQVQPPLPMHSIARIGWHRLYLFFLDNELDSFLWQRIYNTFVYHNIESSIFELHFTGIHFQPFLKTHSFSLKNSKGIISYIPFWVLFLGTYLAWYWSLPWRNQCWLFSQRNPHTSSHSKKNCHNLSCLLFSWKKWLSIKRGNHHQNFIAWLYVLLEDPFQIIVLFEPIKGSFIPTCGQSKKKWADQTFGSVHPNTPFQHRLYCSQVSLPSSCWWFQRENEKTFRIFWKLRTFDY